MNLVKHADASASIRRGADLARGIGDELTAINLGSVFGHERDKRVGNVEMYFRGLAECLGYNVECGG